jgi:SAM-dependent methyltransferase
MMNKIIDLFNSLERRSIKWNSYFDVYEHHFSKFVDKAPKILEIGILGGGSIELWLKYFGESTQVVGVDINPDCLSYKYDGNAEIVMGDQSSVPFWQSLLSKHPEFDIIIDDGSHIMSHQIITLQQTFPHLKNNGVYLCEDTHTSYWQRWGGGYGRSDTFLSHSQTVTDIVNQKHIESDKIPNEALVVFNDLYSVSFYNSIVVFEKRKVEPFTEVASKQE